MQKFSVGIDISKNDFHVCFGSISLTTPFKTLRTAKFDNTQSGCKAFDKWLKETLTKKGDGELSLVMEATGVYFEYCALFLYKAGYKVSVVLPNKSKKYLEALGIKSKTDKADAQGLAKMGAEQHLSLWEPMDGYYYELRALTRHYQMIQETITAMNNRLEANYHGMYAIKQVTKSSEKIKKDLTKELAIIKAAIEQHIESNNEVKVKTAQICEMKGVGVLTVAVVLAETNGFLLFKNASQLVSYAGYDVVENQSGKRVGRTRISKKGNGRIRRALHMPALVTVKHEPYFKMFYERLYQRHGVKMKSYVAVQKKILTTIFALWKKNESFNSEYWKTIKERSCEHPLDGFAEAKKVSLAEQG